MSTEQVTMSAEEAVKMMDAFTAELRVAGRVQRSLEAARAVKAMADALDRASGTDAVQNLIDQALGALIQHCDDDDDSCPVSAFLGTLIGELRRIEDVTKAVSGAAAVALRAAEEVAEEREDRADQALTNRADAEEE